MTTPMTPAPTASHLYQGRREALRPFACLLCRQTASPTNAERFRRLFAETGICGLCHDALDTWAAGCDPTPDEAA